VHCVSVEIRLSDLSARLASLFDTHLAAARVLIGKPPEAVPTPALMIDLPVVRANIEAMADRMRTVPAALRPHAKIHKSPILGRMQMEAGAIGLTTATVWEASAMVAGGLSSVLVCNQVVGAAKAAELARLAGEAEMLVLVESVENADELAGAAGHAGTEIGVLVELDVGLHRSGVRAVDDAVALAEHVEHSDGLRLRGPFGYEGHCMLEPDRELRIEKARAANEELIAFADAMERKGLATEIVAAGGLGTWDITGANERITEIHAGSYIFMDAFHRRLVPGFEPALTVQASVISRTGDMAVVDCGRKAIGIDRAVPELVGARGAVRFEHGEHFIHEEHTALMLDDEPDLGVGSTVRLMPGYAPTTVNLYDCYFVVEDGVVADVWPVCGRYGSATVAIGPR
jgi:D-serine deaminase-like pyridoxal phosphate-dependent protein